MTESLNADFDRGAAIETAAMDWQASPSATVWRKRLMLRGDTEKGAVTSVVRYDAGSTFPAHDHPAGEEILVLDGTFSDEHGDYPAGTFLLNPMGFRHPPFSKDGCTIFVRLRQFAGEGRGHVAIDTNAGRWAESPNAGVSHMVLYQDGAWPERIQLERWEPGARAPFHDHPEMVELFVLEGTFEDEHGRYPAGTWIRVPVGATHAPFSTEGCRLYTKVGTPVMG